MLFYQYLLLVITLFELSFGEIGDLTVRKSSPLVLNKWKHDECSKLLPHAGSCDNAYKVVDEYCEEQAKKIDKNCDETYDKLKISCNNAESKIKDDCKASDGYVTAKCGRKFDRLEKVCKIASETISRTCTQKYKRLDDICSRKYTKNDLKCNRIYKQYEDLCETNLEENVRYEVQSKEELGLEDVVEKVEELKEVKEMDFDDKTYLEKKPALKIEEDVGVNKKLSLVEDNENSSEEFKKEGLSTFNEESLENEHTSKVEEDVKIDTKSSNKQDNEEKAEVLSKKDLETENLMKKLATSQIKKETLKNFNDFMDKDIKLKNAPATTVSKPVQAPAPATPAKTAPKVGQPAPTNTATVKKPMRKLFFEKYDNSKSIQNFKRYPSRKFFSEYQKTNLVKKSLPVVKSFNSDQKSMTRKSFLKDLLEAIQVEKKKLKTTN